MGFSDDTKKNVQAMEVFAKQLLCRYPNMRFFMFDTYEKDDIKTTRIQRK